MKWKGEQLEIKLKGQREAVALADLDGKERKGISARWTADFIQGREFIGYGKNGVVDRVRAVGIKPAGPFFRSPSVPPPHDTDRRILATPGRWVGANEILLAHSMQAGILRAVHGLWDRGRKNVVKYGADVKMGLRSLDRVDIRREKPAPLPPPPTDEERRRQALKRFVCWLPHEESGLLALYKRAWGDGWNLRQSK